jgi:hypothetical protein
MNVSFATTGGILVCLLVCLVCLICEQCNCCRRQDEEEPPVTVQNPVVPVVNWPTAAADEDPV